MHDWWPEGTHREAHGSVDQHLYEGERCAQCGVARLKVDGVVELYCIGKNVVKDEPKCVTE